MADPTDPTAAYSLLGKVEGAEKLFLKGRRSQKTAFCSATRTAVTIPGWPGAGPRLGRPAVVIGSI